MLSLKDIQRIYFIGIGGIGMSAIARFFLHKGVVVSGYDKTETTLTKQLSEEGALIHYTDEVALLDKDVQLVVYTPAIPAQHEELNWYRNNGYKVVKRSDILQIITADSFNICIAGTHGKTSISTMVGHLLRHTEYGCNVFLGGVSVNYGTNFWGSENNVCVVEADEFDRSFHKLSPDIAAITSMDADHLDIYGTVEAMEDAFVEFAQRIKSAGVLIRKKQLKRLDEAPIQRQLTYSLINELHTHDCGEDCHSHDDIPADIHADNIRIEQGGYLFDAYVAGQWIRNVQLNIGGMHNVENMLVAIAVAKMLRIADDKIIAAVADYKGVKRRFEYLWNNQSTGTQVAIDDYAHHPEELRALLNSAKQLYPALAMTVVFQPHLFSRTKDHAAAFAEVLSIADRVVLLPIYPARELPMPGVTSELIAAGMPKDKVQVLTKEEWMADLDIHQPEMLVTAGAGDIDTLLPLVKEKLYHAN